MFENKMAFTFLCLILALCLNTVAAIPKYYMDSVCNRTLDFTYVDTARLKLTAGSSYRPNMDCLLVITSSKPGEKFMLYFEHFNIETSSGCANDWLEVHSGTSIYDPYVSGLSGKLCGSHISNTVRTTSGNNLFLRFKSDSSWHRKGFGMVITQYHLGPCNNNSEFACSNGRCISDSVVCNGHNPCGDYSDCVVALAVGIVVAIVIGSFAFIVIMAIASIIFCRRRRRRNRGIVYQPVNVVATANYGTGYNQSVPQRYTAYPSGQQYPAGQQYPTPQYQK